MKSIEIHTDGACSGNPGPGGFGAVLKYRQFRRELSGGFRRTTNNRMEIFAAVAALELLTEPCEITLYSDSRYLVDAVGKRWLDSWRRSGWRKRDKTPVLNADLWKRLLAAQAPHRIRYVWVRGHAANQENNRCDQLAVTARSGRQLPEDGGFPG